MSFKDRNSNTIEKLSAERLKALEAIEKYSFLSRSKENSNRNLDATNNEESFLDKFRKSKILSFEPEEITGRSTTLQKNDSQNSLEKGRNSKNVGSVSTIDQMFATSICGSLNFDDEDFQAAELMASKFMKDEMSYYEKYAPIPPSSQNKNETSKTWDSDVPTQMSFGDYFANENSLLQQLRSPPKKDKTPFALANLSNSSVSVGSKRSPLNLSTLMKDLNITDSTFTNKVNHNTYIAEKENFAPTESKNDVSSYHENVFSLGKHSNNNLLETTISNSALTTSSSKNDVESEFDKEYEEFLGSPLTKNRVKRRNKSRSRSPNLLSKNEDHLSSTRIEPQIDSERFYNNSSPNNFGKMSLPTYELASGIQKKGSPNSSLFSHRDGKKLPLKTDKFSIAWGSVKLRKLEKQSLQIKNVSPKRLQFRVNVKGPGFDVLNIQGNLITLQAMECRTIEISFCPTVLGLAIGSLIFSSPNNADIPEIAINLCGYGGHIALQHKFGVTPSPVGLPFINMGLLIDLGGTVESTFSINNNGSIHAFFAILVDQVGMDLPGICESIRVKPLTGIIPPKGEAKIVLKYKATRNDLKRIVGKIKNKNAISLANLQILHGDEATRIRIKKMIPELKRTKEFPKCLDKMWDIPETKCVLDEAKTIQESADSVFELIPTLKTRDISLIISNHIWDEQSTIVMPDVDETILFRTIIEQQNS